MTPFQRQAIILSLLNRMNQHGSWCGETHLQKTVYFLESVFDVPLDLDFVLYKHGPYSFDLRGVLADLKSSFLVTLEAKDPYGAKYGVSELGERFLQKFPKTVADLSPAIDFSAREFSAHSVVVLERLATALYVQTTEPELTDAESQANRLHELKPHVPVEDALSAVKEMSKLREVVVPVG
jgi:uncharacterized protein YwgA